MVDWRWSRWIGRYRSGMIVRCRGGVVVGRWTSHMHVGGCSNGGGRMALGVAVRMEIGWKHRLMAASLVARVVHLRIVWRRGH